MVSNRPADVLSVSNLINLSKWQSLILIPQLRSVNFQLILPSALANLRN